MDPKARAAARALTLVRSGMIVGLGSGSTSELFVRGLAARIRDGLKVTGVPTSSAIEALARSLDIPLKERFDRTIDLAVDGADEIDPKLNLIKGRGGAMVREKLVAHAARRFVVIADESKLVEALGKAPVPVEVVPFLHQRTLLLLEDLGARAILRGGGDPVVTDNGNYLVDCQFEFPLTSPPELAAELDAIPGVVGHGLFLGMAAAAIIGGPAGVRTLTGWA
jgi:ribose 5-phosphate isomerase A